MADDAVGPRIGQGAERFDDISRGERDILESGMADGDDEVAPLLGLADEPCESGSILPAADAGAAPRSCGVALAEVDDREPRTLRLERQRRDGFVKAESGPDRQDAVPRKDFERLPEAFQAVVEHVVIGEAGDFERDRGQARDMCGQALEDRAALPNRLVGVGKGTFAVNDPEVGRAENRKHIPVDRLRVP